MSSNEEKLVESESSDSENEVFYSKATGSSSGSSTLRLRKSEPDLLPDQDVGHDLCPVKDLQPDILSGTGPRPDLLSDTPPPPTTEFSLRAKVAVLVVLLSCCSNVIFLELLVRQDAGIGNLVTFSQFLVIAVEGFIFTTRCGKVGPKVPFSAWIWLVIMYFMVSVTNNYALSFHIPMPLHMIFRAGSLMANMLMGMVLMGKRYTSTKYASVLLITLGIATCTVMSATTRVSLKTGKIVFNATTNMTIDCKEEQEQNVTEEADKFNDLMVGVAMLTFALFLSARMGVYQEVLYGKYGKHAKEALFYTHALPLPGFLVLAPDILQHLQVALASPLVPLPFTTLHVPIMILHLLGNVVLQYLCISAVFVITSECTSLTATLLLTTRKFISLLFSIWYFQNPFTLFHWVGTSLVFSGIIMFSDIPGLIRGARDQKKKVS